MTANAGLAALLASSLHPALQRFRTCLPTPYCALQTLQAHSLISSTMDASTAYPPQNSLQAALQPHDSSLSAAHQNREAMDSLATVQLGADGQHEHEHDEAMRLRGGCFNMGLCGCPDCDCCIIPCTIS